MAFGSLSSSQRVMVLLELMGGPKFAAEMRTAAGASGMLGKSVEKTGKQMEVSSRRTFLQNQALYTLRRYAFYGTIAITAMGAAVIKLGYNYLSAMQTARVALSPVIKNQATLNGYLNQLFQIAKYSPFVITDLAVAFRQLFAGLNPVGISAPKIITLMSALTDFMSAAGKTGAGQMQRVAIAIQHMAYAGRVTGYAANQLSRLGIPVAPILRKFGVQDIRNLSKQNISADAFINAIIGYSNTGEFRNAARRQALRTLPGLIQVARDTISQISGRLIQGSYGGSHSGVQGLFTRLFRPGGSFDRISNQKTGRGTLFQMNREVTGGTGLARGLLLLLSVATNVGRVFARVVAPGFIIALHSLIIFYPILKTVNWALGELAKHSTIAKFLVAALATEFVITHFALLGVWGATKLWRIATFGSIKPLMNMIKYIKVLRTVELAGSISRLKDFAFATKQAGGVGAKFGDRVYKNTGFLAGLTRKLLAAASAFGKYTKAATLAGFGTFAAGGVATLGAGTLAYAYSKGFTTPRPTRIGTTEVGTAIVEASGVKYVQAAGRLTRLPPSTPSAGLTIHTHVNVDRKEIASAVARAKADKASQK